jgi:AP-1 complex subunit mu
MHIGRSAIKRSAWVQPPNLFQMRVVSVQGTCSYDATEDALKWTIKNYPSDKEFLLRANVQLPSVKAEEAVTGRGPPIRLKFDIPYNVPSGLQVRYFKVFERSSYAALPWVRYITRSGSYEFRMQ